MIGAQAAARGQIFKPDADPRVLAAEFMIVEDIAAKDFFLTVRQLPDTEADIGGGVFIAVQIN